MIEPFEPSPELARLFKEPGRSWTDEQCRSVLEWLQAPPQYRYLLDFVRHRPHLAVARADAEDLLMAFFVRIISDNFRFLRAFDATDAIKRGIPPEHGFRSYLLATLGHLVLNSVRRSVKRRQGDAPLEVIDAIGPREETVEDRVITLVDRELIWSIVRRKLSTEQRSILLRRLVHGDSFGEIAAEQNISVNAVRAKYYGIVRSLRWLLQDTALSSAWRDWLSWLPSRTGAKLPSSAGGDHIACTVFAPRSVPRKEQCLIQVYAHAVGEVEQAARMALEFDATASRLGVKSLDLAVVPGTRMAFELALPGLGIDEPIQSLTWKGRTDAVSFAVDIPGDCRIGTFIGTVTVSVNSIPAGRIKFRVVVTAFPPRYSGGRLKPTGEEARRYNLAFISYASEDRNKVLARVQMLRLLGIKYFQDVLDLEPGQRWEKELYRHIDECDLFLLFWSKAASGSQWVLKEVTYALRRKGDDEDAPPAIHPVIIEGPPIVPPPPELRHLHFSDRLILFMTPESPSA